MMLTTMSRKIIVNSRRMMKVIMGVLAHARRC
jgi:hypothetical protein